MGSFSTRSNRILKAHLSRPTRADDDAGADDDGNEGNEDGDDGNEDGDDDDDDDNFMNRQRNENDRYAIRLHVHTDIYTL